MVFALNVGRHIPVDIGARNSSQVGLITAEVIDARRCPPKTYRMSVVRKFFAAEQIISLQQRLRRFQLLVSKVIAVIKMRDLVVNRFDCGTSVLTGSLSDKIYRADS